MNYSKRAVATIKITNAIMESQTGQLSTFILEGSASVVTAVCSVGTRLSVSGKSLFWVIIGS